MRMIHTLVVAAILAVTPTGMAPLPPQYLQKTEKGSARYRFWYVTGWEHKVFLYADSPTPTEPKWLTQMAQSFRWLKVP